MDEVETRHTTVWEVYRLLYGKLPAELEVERQLTLAALRHFQTQCAKILRCAGYE